MSFGWDNPDDVVRVLDEVEGRQRRFPETHRAAWAGNLAASDDDPGGTFWYAPGADGPAELTIARALFGQDLPTLLGLLAEFRGITPFLAQGADERASIVRSDVWWGDPANRYVDAVVTAAAGSSLILGPDAPSYQPLVQDAQAVFAGIEYFSRPNEDEDPGDPGFWPDDSDALRAWMPASRATVSGGSWRCYDVAEPAGSGRKNSRSSVASSSGSSAAWKCPPRGSSVHRCTWKKRSACSRGGLPNMLNSLAKMANPAEPGPGYQGSGARRSAGRRSKTARRK